MHWLPEAEMHYSEAARLREPADPIPRLNLAVVRLQGTNPQATWRWRGRHSSFCCANPEVRGQALRELVADSLRVGEGENALVCSKQLIRRARREF